MNDIETRIQYRDPTAYEAIRGSFAEFPTTASIEPREFKPGELRLRTIAISELNRMFPGQAKRKPSRQNHQYRALLTQIALGDFNVLSRTYK